MSTNGTGGSLIVRPEINRPFPLHFTHAEETESPNGFAPDVMFTLVSGKRCYLPVPVAARIAELGGNEFVILKKQIAGQRKINWIINKASSLPAAVHQAIAAPKPAAIEPAYDDGQYWGEPPPASAEERRSALPPAAPFSPAPVPPEPAPAAPRAPAVAGTPSRMTAALMAAIDATAAATAYAKTQGITLKFSEEDVRCVAATIYIQNGRSSQ